MDDSKPSDDAIVYDEDAGTYSVPVGACPVDSASMAVVSLVAALEDLEAPDLSPLFGVVDPDALDSVYESIAANSPDGRIVFLYEGYEITLSADETLTARPTDEKPGPPNAR